MNTIPENIPALPEGVVYLGKGGSFDHHGVSFAGWALGGRWTAGWAWSNAWGGATEDLHFAAPAGSEVALLNGHESVSPCPSECPITPTFDEESDDQSEGLRDLLEVNEKLGRARVAIKDLEDKLAEAIKLGDALATDAKEALLNGTQLAKLMARAHLKFWEAFKAASLKGATK